MNNKGNSSVIVIAIVLIALFFVGTAGSYYYLKSQGKVTSPNSEANTRYVPTTTGNEESGVSNSDELDTLEQELDETSVGSTDSDLQDLNTQASSL